MKKNSKKYRLGILTGGGDCPGLNAVIRAVVKGAFNLGWEVIGIKDGFEGLLHLKYEIIHPQDIKGILNIGGTILGTSNRGNPFKHKIKYKGQEKIIDASNQAVKNFHKLKLTSLICIGGDGTLSIAWELFKKGVPLVGVPKTIDNDLSETVITFGFDTAVSTATDALDKLHSTAESHQRVMVVEMMGRYAGWIALNAGVAGGADIILIPEIPFDMEKVCKKVQDRYKIKRNFAIVVVAEGARPLGGEYFIREGENKGKEFIKLGGVGEWVAREIEKRTKRETRSLVLGHLQRGGNPTTFDRLLATRYGAAAVRLVQKNDFGKMVASHPPEMTAVPLEKAVSKMKCVPLNSDTIISARQLGISFGD